MSKNSDGVLGTLITFAHETLGLSPNQISILGLVVGIIAAGVVVSGHLVSGLLLLALSQIIDGIDGGVARKYGLESEEGKLFELLFDRLNELAIFLALVIAGYASLLMAVLAFVAILCVSLVEPYSHFDPGFKRFVIYFGYMASVLFQVRGFEIALHVIFVANLAGFVAGTIMAEYRLQRDIDIQSIIRREMEIDAGIPQPPPDPPSLLSKLFA